MPLVAGRRWGPYQTIAPAGAGGMGDIFGLGCVLYEMVTGRRTFEGKSTAKVVAAIMTTEPTPFDHMVAVGPSRSRAGSQEVSGKGSR
jgi:serine/threonine protein kinase